MQNAIVPHSGNGQMSPLNTASSGFMPLLSIDNVLERHAALLQFRTNVLREGTDFGTIPGTGQKPTLLKPGAEKLCTLFGLTVRFEIAERIEDWTGKNYDGEAFFYYLYRASLWRGPNLVAEADGSCNSRETKYRYRKGERVCPECGQPTIIKGKAEYGGGYICFAKKGGCGQKFPNGDPDIESQVVGRIANPDIADVVNTIQKMAQKRALVAATLIGVNASEFFTQDVEDFAHADYVPAPRPPVEEDFQEAVILLSPESQEAARKSFFVLVKGTSLESDATRKKWVAHCSGGGFDSLTDYLASLDEQGAGQFLQRTKAKADKLRTAQPSPQSATAAVREAAAQTSPEAAAEIADVFTDPTDAQLAEAREASAKVEVPGIPKKEGKLASDTRAIHRLRAAAIAVYGEREANAEIEKQAGKYITEMTTDEKNDLAVRFEEAVQERESAES